MGSPPPGRSLTREGKLYDSQRSKVYRAEKILKGWEPTPDLSEVEAIQDYVDELTSTRWFTNRWPGMAPIEVRDGRGRRRASGNVGYIKMPRWTREEYQVLHEVAHAICEQFEEGWVPWHGREFVATLLELVRYQMGDGAWHALKYHLRTNGVRHTRQPRTRSA